MKRILEQLNNRIVKNLTTKQVVQIRLALKLSRGLISYQEIKNRYNFSFQELQSILTYSENIKYCGLPF